MRLAIQAIGLTHTEVDADGHRVDERLVAGAAQRFIQLAFLEIVLMIDSYYFVAVRAVHFTFRHFSPLCIHLDVGELQMAGRFQRRYRTA
jgi:hypothetical protein